MNASVRMLQLNSLAALLLVLLAANGAMAQTVLPDALGTVDTLYMGWGIAFEEPSDVGVTFGLGDQNIQTGWYLPQPSPDGGDYWIGLRVPSGYSTSTVTEITSLSRAFNVTWNLEVRTPDEAPRVFFITQYGDGALPETASAVLVDEEGVELADLKTLTGPVILAPGQYRVIARNEPYAAGIKVTYKLQPGWNLVGVPFVKVDNAGGLFNHPVFTHAMVRVNGSEELQYGQALWVQNKSAAEVSFVVTGEVPLAKSTESYSRFPAFKDGWNFAGVHGVARNGAMLPCGEEVTGYKWDPATKQYRKFTGIVSLYEAIVIKP